MPYQWTPEAIIHHPLIEHVHLAPDGSQVLFTVRTAHLTDEASEFRNQMMLVATTGGQPPVQLTFAEAASQPRWSPDGHYIAFLRKMKDGDQQTGLWVMRASGGEAWPLTGVSNNVRNAITNFAWRPDGQQLAFVTVPYDEAKAKRLKARDDVYRWHADYDYAHLHVVDFAPGSATAAALPAVKQLTQGERCVMNFSWSPDGAAIAYTHRPTPLLDTWPQARLAMVAVEGNVPSRDLLHVRSWNGTLAWSPDGQWIGCDLGDEDGGWAFGGRAVIIPVAGGDLVPLAQVSDQQPGVLGWTSDSSALLVLNHVGLASQVLALPVDGSAAQIVVDNNHLCTLAHVNTAGSATGQIALVLEDFHEANSIYVTDASVPGGTRKVATPSSPHLLTTAPLPKIKLLSWRTPDNYEIEGILYLPADYDENSDQRIPLLLHIHGGPASVFQRAYAGNPYYYTPAALCERGIAVLRCNPRGSGGYGRAFRLANRRDWGGGDYGDLQQGVDEVIKLGIADPDRLGICGWSYGGFMTSWTLTQTQRFRAASIGAPVTNLVSFNGTADIPGFIPDYFQAEAWGDPAIYASHSPITHAHLVRTPAIIQHGDADVRVPLEQGLQYYNVLLRNGVPVTLYIYPRQGHALSEPRLIADALRRNLEWFSEKL